ncbi:MAG TPA: hypothetical protein VFI47_03710 [Acidimicrobiales bacterium]|nr:hypothetical protein [Acidimicrobiales bacterium]
MTASPEDTGLLPVLRDFAAAGFTADLMATEGGVFCAVCRSVSAPEDLLVHWVRRLEGASDPADMLAVVGATCRGCGSDGTLVLGFGPDADPAEADVLGALALPPASGAVGRAPGETPL